MKNQILIMNVQVHETDAVFSMFGPEYDDIIGTRTIITPDEMRRDGPVYSYNMNLPKLKKSRSLNNIPDLVKELNGRKPDLLPFEEKPKTCQICFTEKPNTFLDCQCELFCRECIGKSFESQVDLQGSNVIFRCPNNTCRNIIPTETVFNFTSNEFQTKFQNWRNKQRETIENNAGLKTKLWKWWNCKKCPNCSVHTEKTEGCDTMNCSWCGTTWCWGC